MNFHPISNRQQSKKEGAKFLPFLTSTCNTENPLNAANNILGLFRGNELQHNWTSFSIQVIHFWGWFILENVIIMCPVFIWEQTENWTTLSISCALISMPCYLPVAIIVKPEKLIFKMSEDL